MIKLMLITNDPEIAKFAVKCGVNRIFVDLEVLGKKKRQGHLDTFLSNHEMKDVRRIRDAVPKIELMVRLNPFHKGTAGEIEKAIVGGADLLMLPMYKTSTEVARFCKLVNGRAGVVPLLETPGAVGCLSELGKISGIKEIFIGLNDLHLGFGLDFMFELLVNGIVENMVEKIKGVGLPFGFGGIAKIGDGLLSSEKILGEHLRLGSSSVILSRTFYSCCEGIDNLKTNMDLELEIFKLRQMEEKLSNRSKYEIKQDQKMVVKIVENIVKEIKKVNSN
jgi:hypothetical protein